MAEAREALRGKWGLAVGTVLVYMLITVPVGMIPILGWLFQFLCGGPFVLGIAIFALTLARKQDARLSQIFDGFRKFATALGAYLLIAIFVVLWSLLLIVPGIMAALAYSQAYYIISESDSIGALDAISRSKRMMMGNKWKLFCLYWRFFGWALLCMLTFGIGFLWLTPYVMVSMAKFYDDLKEQAVVMPPAPAIP